MLAARIGCVPARPERDVAATTRGTRMPPTLANGKICYIEMPATDIRRSADFYHAVFGWRLRQRGDGATAFDDTTGEVSGTWVRGRPPAETPGLLFYIMVDSVSATIDAIVAQGCDIVQPIGADAPEITARFRDPGGNVIGLYQEPGK
jgi:uncharacterized protein